MTLAGAYRHRTTVAPAATLGCMHASTLVCVLLPLSVLCASVALWFRREARLWRDCAQAWQMQARRVPRAPALTVAFPLRAARALDVHSKRTVVGEPLFDVEASDFVD